MCLNELFLHLNWTVITSFFASENENGGKSHSVELPLNVGKNNGILKDTTNKGKGQFIGWQIFVALLLGLQFPSSFRLHIAIPKIVFTCGAFIKNVRQIWRFSDPLPCHAKIEVFYTTLYMSPVSPVFHTLETVIIGNNEGNRRTITRPKYWTFIMLIYVTLV